MVKLAVAVWAVGVSESVTVTVKGVAPTVVGVPEITPALLKLKPAGGVPDQLYGPMPPLACKVAPRYTTLTTPCGSELEVVATASGAAATVMLRLACAVCAVGVSESVTVTVKFEVATAFGVPEMTPALLKLKPTGKLPPVRLHL